MSKNLFKSPVPKVQLHPVTIKTIKKGHPWITADSYSQKFPSNNYFLIGTDSKRREQALMINDANHKRIKARIWSLKEPFINQINNFPHELTKRLSHAFLKRNSLVQSRERDNYYLLFGESDFVPGLFIQKFGNNLLIQNYIPFWHQTLSTLLKSLSKALKDIYPEWNQLVVWFQDRTNSNKSNNIKNVRLPNFKSIKPKKEFIISEFGIKYKIRITNFDQGLYTDMASFRKKLVPFYDNAKSVLNLFSYTGAFSLNALKYGAEKVISVDISKKHMSWLEENISLNPEIKESSHRPLLISAQKALNLLNKEKQEFDLIIIDPPSISSDGKRIINALKNYDQLLPKAIKLASSNGYILLLLNTRKVSWIKFENKIKSILNSLEDNKKIKIINKFSLDEDCSTTNTFGEGNYLKGMLLKKQY